MLKSKGLQMSRCGLNISFYIGDEYGDPSPLGYKVRSERRTSTHGPWSWSLHQRKCNAAVCQQLLNSGEPFHMNSCCHRVEYCANTNANKCKNEVCLGDLDEGDDSDCTMIDHFISTSMMSPDVGLYHKFSTDEDGRPFGCPGMDAERWVDNRRRHSDITSCPMNDDTATEDGKTMAEVMEMYAKDNVLWVNDFMNVYQVMLENGVNSTDLVESPTAWFKARCNDRKVECRAV